MVFIRGSLEAFQESRDSLSVATCDGRRLLRGLWAASVLVLFPVHFLARTRAVADRKTLDAELNITLLSARGARIHHGV